MTPHGPQLVKHIKELISSVERLAQTALDNDNRDRNELRELYSQAVACKEPRRAGLTKARAGKCLDQFISFPESFNGQSHEIVMQSNLNPGVVMPGGDC